MDFYLLNNFALYKKEKLKNTRCGKHYLKIKEDYFKFLKKNNKLLNQDMLLLKKNNTNCLEEINDILSSIMEWYICANIYKNKKKSIIIHIGLAHSEKVLKWLLEHYNYDLLKQYGINSMNNSYITNMTGCVVLETDIVKDF